MKKIKCAGGEIAIVDDEDYPLLSRHKWWYTGGKKKYPTATFNSAAGTKRNICMHTMVFGYVMNVDHRDGDTLNNRKRKLRASTKSQNGANSKKMVLRKGMPTSSKYKGVHWATMPGKWRAVIRCEGVTYQLGSFNNEDDAGRAYNKAAKKMFGEYSRLNIVK